MTDTSVADTTPPANGAAAAALNSPPPAPAFHESFQNAETKAWAAGRGFKSGEELADFARKFDTFKDADPASLTVKPKGDDPNALVAFAQEHLGAPKDGAAYGLDKIEGVDPAFAGEAAGWGAEAGLTPFQMQHLAGKFVAKQKADDEVAVKEEKIAAERELTQLRTDLGEAGYTETTAMGKRALNAAARAVGMDEKSVTGVVNYIESGVGVANTLKLLSFFGKFIKEGDFIDGERGTQEPNDMAKRWYGGG